MRNIIITSGTYGHYENGRLRPKDASSGAFAVSEAEAERLVSLELARYADTPVATPEAMSAVDEQGVRPAEDNDTAEGEYEDEDKPLYDESSSVSELRAIAKEHGLTFRVGMSKADMITALNEFFADAPTLEAEDPLDGI